MWRRQPGALACRIVGLRLLLVVGVPELRGLLSRTLALHPGFTVVAEAGDGTAAVSLADQHHPDIVLLDLGMADLAGRDLLTRLRAVAPGALVVVVNVPYAPDGHLVTRLATRVRSIDDVRYVVHLLEEIDTRTTRNATIALTSNRREVALARRFVVDRCVEWNRSSAADDAAIVVSELVANALVHASSGCELTVGLRGDVLRIDVADHGGGMPDVQRATSDDDHGRGLLLVSLLCTAWGTEPRGDGKAVWAELRAAASAVDLGASYPGAGGGSGAAVGDPVRDPARVDVQRTVV